MPRLFAPAGVTSFSHAGHNFEVEADGTIDVMGHVAEDLKSHGFTPEPPKPSEHVAVKRADLVVALEKLGVAVNPALPEDKLAAALAAAVAAKDNKAKPTLSIDKSKPA